MADNAWANMDPNMARQLWAYQPPQPLPTVNQIPAGMSDAEATPEELDALRLKLLGMAPDSSPPPVEMPVAAAPVQATATPAVQAPPVAAQAKSNDLADAMAQLDSGSLEALKRQGLTVEALQKQLGETKAKELPMDLTPLVGLVDTWTGSKLGNYYKAPESEKDRQAAIEKLQGAIAAGQNNLSENQLAMLRSKLNNQFQIKNLEATEAQRKEQNAIERAKIAATGVTAGNKSKFWDSADSSIGKEYDAYKAGGGYSTVKSNLGAVSKVLGDLKTNPNLTGPSIGLIPDAALKISNPDAAEAEQTVNSAVQNSLKQILGAQFTEKEGVRILKQSYDRGLPAAANARKLDRLITQMQEAAVAKEASMKYAEEHGTLRGFKGKVWSPSDFGEESSSSSSGLTREQKIAKLKALKGE